MRTCNIVTFILCMFFGTARCDGGARHIPRDFMLGSGISAYQYEGAWNEDGRTPSYWDVALHTVPDATPDRSNADIAADGYHHYREDVKLIKQMGLDSFRFSFSWSRILPDVYANNINQAGIDFYNSFVDELIKHNITPVATLFQEDTPAKLRDYGGWTNPAVIDFYLDYVKVVFDNFADRVKLWITVNEPVIFCYYYYGNFYTPPNVYLSGVGDYICMKNMLVAHARAYRLYEKHYKQQHNGKVGLTLYNNWHEPLTNSTEDIEGAEEANELITGFFLNAIFTEDGDFPEVAKRRIAASSASQGFPRSRLPTLSSTEIDMIKGTADFVGLNFYTTVSVYRNASVDTISPGPSLRNDMYVGVVDDPAKSKPDATIVPKPWGLYKLLMKIRDQYKNPPVFITENGCISNVGLNDSGRIEYINAFLNTIMDAKESGCNVQGYSMWSFMDVFEYRRGYLRKFGLYEVDFSSPNRTRTARRSAHYYKNITTTRKLHRKLSLQHDYLL